MTRLSTIPNSLEAIIGNQPIRAEWIRFQLRLNGSSNQSIARAVGNVTGQAVGQCVAGKFHNRAIEAEIAQILNIPVERLFSERYQTPPSAARR